MLATIRFLTGPLTSKTFEITSPSTTFGRDKSNDIIISDQKVSRFHARLVYDNGLWNIENLSQTNTVTVDQDDVEQAVLSENTTIDLGEAARFLFSLPPAASVQGEETGQKKVVHVRSIGAVTNIEWLALSGA